MSICGLQAISRELADSFLSACHRRHTATAHGFTLSHFISSRRLHHHEHPIIDMHQDLPRLIQAVQEGRPIYVFTGRGPSSLRLHLGHLVPFLFARLLTQSLKAHTDTGSVKMVVQLSDDEKYLRADGTVDREKVSRMCSMNEADIWRVGFERQNTIMFRNTDMMAAFYPYYLQVCKHLPLKLLSSVMGISVDDNVKKKNCGTITYPPMQIVPCIPQAVGLPPDSVCVIPCAIDQYPFFRLARHVLKRLSLSPPVLLCTSQYLPSLRGPMSTISSSSSSSPSSSVSNNNKMSSSDPRSAIFMGDDEETVTAKVRKAYSAAPARLADHHQHGADTTNDFAAQVLRFFMTDTQQYNDIITGYRHGTVPSLQVKQHAAMVINNLFKSLHDDHDHPINESGQCRQSS